MLLFEKLPTYNIANLLNDRYKYNLFKIYKINNI